MWRRSILHRRPETADIGIKVPAQDLDRSPSHCVPNIPFADEMSFNTTPTFVSPAVRDISSAASQGRLPRCFRIPGPGSATSFHSPSTFRLRFAHDLPVHNTGFRDNLSLNVLRQGAITVIHTQTAFLLHLPHFTM